MVLPWQAGGSIGSTRGMEPNLQSYCRETSLARGLEARLPRTTAYLGEQESSQLASRGLGSPFLPTSAQGATQAMEDGVTLAVCLQ